MTFPSGLTKHRPDLDGLRGLAILLVLIEHTAVVGSTYLFPVTPAMAGVTTFFVLSGYLITGLLLRETRIDLRNFYLRRVLRLGPGLAVVVIVVATLGLLGLDPFPWLPGVVGSMLYMSNWANALGVPTALLNHTWTLAIEEQFYLLWPLTMLLVPRRWLLPITIALAVAGCVMYAQGIGPFFYSTFTNGGAILAGCAAALAGKLLPRIAGLLGIALILIGAVIWWQGMVVVGAVFLVASPVDALLPIAALGRRAYSLYLWSWPLVMLFGGLLALPLTLAAAEASYRLVERPVHDKFHARLAPRGARSNTSHSALADSVSG